jgi:hypothetical protein
MDESIVSCSAIPVMSLNKHRKVHTSLTPWSRVLYENLIVILKVKKFSCLSGT